MAGIELLVFMTIGSIIGQLIAKSLEKWITKKFGG